MSASFEFFELPSAQGTRRPTAFPLPFHSLSTYFPLDFLQDSIVNYDTSCIGGAQNSSSGNIRLAMLETCELHIASAQDVSRSLICMHQTSFGLQFVCLTRPHKAGQLRNCQPRTSIINKGGGGRTPQASSIMITHGRNCTRQI